MHRALHHSQRSHRRGSVVVIVLWTIAVAGIVVSSVQLFGYRQATHGREALERVQARWAARAGIEDTLAVMTEHTERPLADDARAMFRDMYYVHAGQTLGAEYSIIHQVDGNTYGGPMDEHSKININRQEDRGLIMVFDDITLDIVDAVSDWIDEDSEVSAFGVERDYYLSLEGPYLPRNGPLRTLGELELIAGIWPRYFRGEDWNLNHRLDPNEDDSGRSFPPDDPDGMLNGEWSSRLTVYSVANGATGSGLPRLRLRSATIEEIQERTGLDEAQATMMKEWGKVQTNQLSDLIVSSGGSNSNESSNNEADADEDDKADPNSRQATQPRRNPSAPNTAAPNLTDDEIALLLSETSVTNPLIRQPGKMNINTIPAQLLRDIFELQNMDEALADEILFMRSSRPQGIVSLVDLKQIPNITAEDLRALTQRFDVVSNVFTISSRGRSQASGLEVEIIVVVDRSTVPVRILEYREQ